MDVAADQFFVSKKGKGRFGATGQAQPNNGTSGCGRSAGWSGKLVVFAGFPKVISTIGAYKRITEFLPNTCIGQLQRGIRV